jgi:hypothetical protein
MLRSQSSVQQCQIVQEALKGQMGGRLQPWRCKPEHRSANPNGCAVLPVGSFPESHSPISPFGGVKVGDVRAI